MAKIWQCSDCKKIFIQNLQPKCNHNSCKNETEKTLCVLQVGEIIDV